MKKNIIIFIVLALLLLAIGLLWYLFLNILEVENKSGKLAKEITITVSGQDYYLEDLSSGESKRIIFKVKRDSGFHVDVTFNDDSKVSGDFGYVMGGTRAYNNKAKVKIFSDSIEGTQK